MQTNNKRKYNEYVEEVREAVERKLESSVTVQKFTKNNGLVLDGLTIMREGVNLSPTIYLKGCCISRFIKGENFNLKKSINLYFS